MDKIKLIQETAKEMYGCSFDEIEQGGRSLLVLNRCLDIVIEQLELTAVVQAKPEKVRDCNCTNPVPDIMYGKYCDDCGKHLKHF